MEVDAFVKNLIKSRNDEDLLISGFAHPNYFSDAKCVSKVS